MTIKWQWHLFKFFLGLFLVGSFGLMQPHPADASVSIRIEPATIDLWVGETKIIVVQVDGIDGNGLTAFQLALKFDPSLLQISDPNNGYNPYAPLGAKPDGQPDPLCGSLRGTAPDCPDPSWFLTSTDVHRNLYHQKLPEVRLK